MSGAETKMPRGQIWCVPDLFRYQANPLGKLLEGVQIRMRITTGRKLVMPTLARQQRPRAPYSPTLIRPAIVTLAVAIVIVAAPAWAHGSLDLEHGINNAQ